MMQTNKKSRKTCLFLLVLYYWEKTNKSPNLEPYVVLVSYTLWCSSYYISEAVLLSLEDFPFVLCFGGGVSLYRGRNSHICWDSPTWLLATLLLSTCYLFYLDLHVTLLCSTMLLYPSLKCPTLLLCVVRTVTMLPQLLWVPACLVPCYTLLPEYIYCNGPSHLHTEHLTSQGDNHLNTTYGLFACCEIMRRSVFSQCTV